MFIRKRPLTKEDLCLFLNEQTAKVINNFEARNGRLKSFELNFNFENSNYRLTDQDLNAFRTRNRAGNQTRNEE
jgi:hypothetical protein